MFGLIDSKGKGCNIDDGLGVYWNKFLILN